MSASDFVFEISKAAMKLVKAGKAVLSSGGVRMLDGTMYEMAKPVTSAISGLKLGINPVMSGINLASSLASNVQSAFIQAGVDKANMKLDNVLTKLDSISKAMQGLQAVQVLTWVNTAFSLANCGISVVGFHMTLSRLSSISDQINEFYQQYEQDRHYDKVEKYNEIMNNLKNDLGNLKSRGINETFDDQYYLVNAPFIEEHINQAVAFINEMIDEFVEENPDGQTACQIIFMLAAVLSQSINEYCCQYYYVHKTQHHMYDSWIAFLDKINSEPFISALKKHFTFTAQYATLSPAQKAAAIKISLEGIQQEQNRLQVCNTTVKLLPESVYRNADDIINQQLFIELPHYYPELQKVNLDDRMTEKIQQGLFFEDSETEKIWIEV